ncbi:hypothetical protein E7V67_011465 [[Empedobacter] haloabium]|uniref:DUF1376 domain-containing protein n=1 Tax=[Empedobacter] haloabium TaxID=592317 RepID=A0ABZ1USH7_9BURK
MRSNLWDDPRVARLVEETDQSEAAVIGGLYWLWATADQHSSDGLLHGMTTRTIDRKTGVSGLGKALIVIGWLSENDEGVTVSRFDEHNGASAKSRAQTAKRVANHKGNAKVTQAALPESGQSVSGALPREREEKEKEEEPSSAASGADQPELPPEVPAARAGDGVPPAPATLLSIAMRRAGIDCQPADPRLAALAAQGVTPETAAAACAEAKGAKPGERIGLGYVVAILNRWSADAAKVQAGGANGARASPRQAQQANTQTLLDRINGKQSHDPQPRIIDIN